MHSAFCILHSALKKSTLRQIAKKTSVRGVDQFRTVPPGRFTSFYVVFTAQWYPIRLHQDLSAIPSLWKTVYSLRMRGRVGRVFAV